MKTDKVTLSYVQDIREKADAYDVALGQLQLRTRQINEVKERFPADLEQQVVDAASAYEKSIEVFQTNCKMSS